MLCIERTSLNRLTMARLPITAETRRALTEYDPRWPLKLGMRAVATFFAFIDLLLFPIATGLSIKNYGGSDWVDGMPIAPVCLRWGSVADVW